MSIGLEMTQNRYNDLKVALYERIKEKGPCDDLALLTWLVSRLDEWVERLEGAFSCGRIMPADFFGMFMIAIEVIDEVKTTSEFKQVFPERESMEFRNRFAAISGRNSSDDRQLCTKFGSKTSRTDGNQSLEQDGPREKAASELSQVEWWPRSTLPSPAIRTSRAILSVAILLLLGSLFFFANFLFEKSVLIPAHFRCVGRVPRITGNSNLVGSLGLVSFPVRSLFAVWTVYRLWLLRKSQK
jgi:hypothetical protein